MNNIEAFFSNRRGRIMGNHEKSSVVIFLTNNKENPSIVFQVRALSLKHQPGDISLPGGRIEKGESEREAAIREAIEELNITKKDFQLIGEMDYLVTPYNRVIYPFVAIINEIDIYPNEDEVDHIFMVPLKYFMENEPEAYRIKMLPQFPEDFPYHLISNGKNYKFSSSSIEQYFYQFNGYVIWGITAQIIKTFVDLIRE
ncbi:CoA pyrophosphatase [Clostridium malenominatum]